MAVAKDNFFDDSNSVGSGWWSKFENIWDTYKWVFTWEAFIKDTTFGKQKVYVFDKVQKMECEIKDSKIVWTKSSEDIGLVNIAIKVTNTMIVSKMDRVMKWCIAWIAYVADYDSGKWNPAKTLQVFWGKEKDLEWAKENIQEDELSIEDIPF